MSSTLKDVAALAGVSLTTASNAINEKPVNANTKERVLDAAKKLKYHTSSIGRNLIKNKSNAIGMIILNSKKSKDITEEISYYYAMIKGALASIQQHDYVFNFEVMYWEDIEYTEYFPRKVFSKTIDGMILVPQFMYNYSFLPLLEEEHFPYVIINPSVNIRPECRAVIDNFQGGYLAADHLLNLGHKRILFINGPADHKDSYEREKGFLARLLESGIPYDKCNILYSDFTNNGGYTLMKKILEEKGRTFSAVFCANDYMASGAMNAIFEAGFRIPEDFSVIGFDDTDIAKCIYPGLTTVKSPVKELGFKAAERIFELMSDKNAEKDLQEINLSLDLVIRGSTKCNTKDF